MDPVKSKILTWTGILLLVVFLGLLSAEVFNAFFDSVKSLAE